MSCYYRLQIAKKYYEGQLLGFIVGWRTYKRGSGGYGFRRIRESTIFDTLQEAEAYRDYIEYHVKETRPGRLTYEIVA
jgi:hypothetical protein